MTALLFLLLSAVAGEPTLAEEPCSVLTGGESQIIERTNSARAEAGLQPLVVDCRLMGSARRHAQRMARAGSMFHSAGVAENVAMGQPFAGDAVVVWLRSPGHRANILGRQYRRIGVAGVVGPNGRTYWVQQFSF
jgi:uncharacterized protein YkwD